MAVTTVRPLPITRDLSFVFRITDATATLLVASSVAGLLYGPRGWWYDSNPATLPAFLGQDVMTLLVGVPLLLGSALRARHGSLRGLLCWIGALFYVAYSYYFYVIGVRFNAFLPLYIVIVSLGLYGTLTLLYSLDLSRLAARLTSIPSRPVSTFLMVTALALAGMWLSRIDAHLVIGTPLDSVSRILIAVHGVVLLPLLFHVGRALGRHDAVGYALAAPLLLNVAAMFLTLIVTAAIGSRWQGPSDDLQIWASGVGFVAASALLVSFLERVAD